ncbi:hypothetical protein Pr1d_37320 [Bythopirellula goksoeyrii]|uniref:Carboxypeptidase regulatory-like domain-containing protein n=2 Tax=Bythopirellula goksoeyrii TaxID=1400387 RepID=A0A5B9QBU3_9BACT|nr:hypothetical protein Pr1d_37320 [Bythopirellula goksoeyrii]
MGESVVMKKIFRSCERSLSVVLCVIGALLLVGCGGKPASVSGTVTLDGKPLERGVVGFAPVNGGMRAAGMIQSDGSYVLSTNRDSGLETGDYLTTVSSREPGTVPAQGGPPMPGPYITPRRYAISSTSGLQFKVEKGSNTIDIELSSEGLDNAGTTNRKR